MRALREACAGHLPLIGYLILCVGIAVAFVRVEAALDRIEDLRREATTNTRAQTARIAENQRFIACRLIETKHNVMRYVISEDNDESDRRDNDVTEVRSAVRLVRDFKKGKDALRERIGDGCLPPLAPLPRWQG